MWSMTSSLELNLVWHSVIELSVIVWIHQCAYDFGEWVTDSLGKVLQEGYIMGPFYKNDVPFEANKLSGLMAKTWRISKANSIFD